MATLFASVFIISFLLPSFGMKSLPGDDLFVFGQADVTVD